MRRERVRTDIALRFWKGDARDERVAQILESVPAGDKNSYIKNLILAQNEGQHNNESEESVQKIIKESLVAQQQEFKNQLKEMEMNLLLQISNMFGRFEGSFQTGAFVMAQPAGTPPFPETAVEKIEEPEISDDVLNFLDTL